MTRSGRNGVSVIFSSHNNSLFLYGLCNLWKSCISHLSYKECQFKMATFSVWWWKLRKWKILFLLRTMSVAKFFQVGFYFKLNKIFKTKHEDFLFRGWSAVKKFDLNFLIMKVTESAKLEIKILATSELFFGQFRTSQFLLLLKKNGVRYFFMRQKK